MHFATAPQRRLCLFDEGQHFLGGHLVAHVGAFEERVGQGAFGVVEAEDFLFDGVLGDEVIDGDLLLLADAVGAVGGLLFDGRIPPGVKVDDVVGPREVEAEAARLERDEEGRELVQVGANG